jgi:alcohol dehydrogenase
MESLSALNISGLPKIHFGAGVFSELPEIMQSYGHNALIITGGESLKKSGRGDALPRQLNQAQIKYKAVSVWDEPATEIIDAIVSEFRKTPVDVVVAIGGGSVIDFGKAVSAMLAADGSVKDYLEDVGTKKPAGAKIPFIAVPTTAGTGSEVTKNAVVCDRKDGYKKSLRHDAYVPDVALVDPELTLSLPRHITIACGLDAVSQLIESYTSTKADVSIDALALKALAYISESLLPLALGQSNDVSLRAKMSYAALVSGITLSKSGLGAVHGIAGPMGGLFPVPHGVACGKLLFPAMTFVIKKIIDEKNVAAQKRFADIGKIFSGDGGGDDIFYCKQFLGVLDKWTKTLKLPQLSRFGMTAAHMEKIISLADSKNSPSLLSKEEIKLILEVVR